MAFNKMKIMLVIDTKPFLMYCWYSVSYYPCSDRRDRMVVGFTTTYAISAYHH
jgi:hypothetical protein